MHSWPHVHPTGLFEESDVNMWICPRLWWGPWFWLLSELQTEISTQFFRISHWPVWGHCHTEPKKETRCWQWTSGSPGNPPLHHHLLTTFQHELKLKEHWKATRKGKWITLKRMFVHLSVSICADIPVDELSDVCKCMLTSCLCERCPRLLASPKFSSGIFRSIIRSSWLSST